MSAAPGWLAVHLLAAGAWIGCLWTELVFERLLAGQDPAALRWLARLHWRVDRWVEVPAMGVVAATGVGLWPGGSASVMLMAMAVSGGGAVLANALCVAVVLRRWQAAEAGDAAGFVRWDAWQHRLGGLVFVGVHAAVLIGLAQAVGVRA